MADLDSAPIAPAGSIGVPVIDLRGDPESLVRAVGQACRDWGFFQVVGHDVPHSEIDSALATARRFFALPRDAKRAALRTRDNPWGYYDRELTKEQRDRKEVFDIGPDAIGAAGSGDAFDGATRWPPQPPEFRPVLTRWCGLMARLSNQLIGLIGASLTGRSEELRRAFEPDHTGFLRINHYPVDDPLAGEANDDADLGIHHHTDAGALTVLLQDATSGLQVLHDGHWHDVPPVPGAFTINIGDMVQVWSNDRYRAALHRVLAMTSAERFSIPYFYNPSYSTVVEPLVGGEPRYRPIPWGEFRRRRADGDFADYGTEVQISQYRR